MRGENFMKVYGSTDLEKNRKEEEQKKDFNYESFIDAIEAIVSITELFIEYMEKVELLEERVSILESGGMKQNTTPEELK